MYLKKISFYYLNNEKKTPKFFNSIYTSQIYLFLRIIIIDFKINFKFIFLFLKKDVFD